MTLQLLMDLATQYHMNPRNTDVYLLNEGGNIRLAILVDKYITDWRLEVTVYDGDDGVEIRSIEKTPRYDLLYNKLNNLKGVYV